MKICKRCRNEKALTEFYGSNTNKDAYMSLCKECHLMRIKDRVVNALNLIKNVPCYVCGEEGPPLNNYLVDTASGRITKGNYIASLSPKNRPDHLNGLVVVCLKCKYKVPIGLKGN